MRASLKLLVETTMALIAAGCAIQPKHDNPALIWVREPAWNIDDCNWQPAPREVMQSMTFERDANTVRFLDDVWFVVRPSGNERNNGTWLTVRAVAFSESAGNYSVYQCEDGKRLWIAYGCLGHRGNLARTPLRIHVQKVPIEIFVSARAAM